jgi:hypothetical protein
VGRGKTDANGDWTVTSKALQDGIHELRATATDAANNPSGQSAALQFKLDTQVAVLGLALASDSGFSGADGITKNGIINLSGLEAGGTWEYSLDNGTNWNQGSGSTISLDVDGSYGIKARQVDLAGNVSADSSTLSVTKDTQAGQQPGAPVLSAGSDTGTSSSDNVTQAVSPVFNGSGVEAGATVRLFSVPLSGTTQTWTGIADANGNWSISTNGANAGINTFSVEQEDAAGNISSRSAGLTVTIDRTHGPITDINGAIDRIVLGSANGTAVGITANATGTKVGGYSLVSNPNDLFAIDANSGVVTLAKTSALNAGTHTIQVRAEDLAGNIDEGFFNVAAAVPNTPPTINGLPYSLTFNEDSTTYLGFTVGDIETSADSLTITASAPNSWLFDNITVTGTGANRTLTLDPKSNLYGSSQITVTVTDSGNLSTSHTFLATINPVNDAPVAENDFVASALEDQSQSWAISTLLNGSTWLDGVILRGKDTDAEDGQPLFYGLDGLSSLVSKNVVGGTVSKVNDTIVFTPIKGFYGQAQFSYSVVDSGWASDTAIVTFNVNPWEYVPTSQDFEFNPWNDKVNDKVNYKTDVAKLYVAFFNRPADLQGENTWVGREQSLRSSLSASYSGNDLYQKVMMQLGSDFGNSEEFKNTYNSLTDDQLVAKIYHNLFGREAAQWEINHWVQFMTPPQQVPHSRGELIGTIISSAHYSDITTSLNKARVAEYFTYNLGDYVNVYASETNHAYVGNYLQTVTSNEYSVFDARHHVQDAIHKAIY